MKLHIPSKLRSALLASMVALIPFSGTIGTGTLLLTALSSTHTLAVEETIGENSVNAGGARRRIFGDATVASGDTAALAAITWTADDKVIMDFTSGFFGGTAGTTNVGTIEVRDWLMTLGSGNFSGTFNSNLVSPDDFETMADSGDIQAGAAQEGAWTFNGDHSQFEGDFVNFRDSTNTWTINFLHSDGAANLTDVSGKGAIRNHENKATARTILIYQFFDDGAPRVVSITNPSIEAYDMVLSANGTNNAATTGADYTVTSALNVTNILSIWDEATAILTHGNNTVASMNVAVANSRFTIGSGTGAALTTVTGAVTNAGSIHVANNATLTTGGQISGAGTLHVAAGGTLNINGTLTATETAIANAGTLNFGADARIDLSVLGLRDSYTIFSGGTVTGFTDLTEADLTGVSLTGRSANFSPDGTITLTIDGNLHIIAGSPDPINWGIGTIFDPATGAYADGEAVTVEGDATLVMTENLSSSLFTVDAGVELTLESEAGETNKLNATINVDGTLTLVGDVLHTDTTLTSTDTAAAGTIHFDIGAGNEINYGNQLDDFAGDLVIESGQLIYQGTNAISVNDPYDIEVLAGATLKLASVSLAQADVTLNGSAGSADNRATLDIANVTLGQALTATGYTAGRTPDGIAIFSSLFTLNGDMEWTANQSVSFNAGMTGSGTFTKLGSNTIAVNGGNLSFAGDIVVGAGIFQIGDSGADELNPNAIQSITVESGAQLRMFHDETDMSATTLTLRGATLQNHGMGTSTTLTDVATLSTYTTMKKLVVENGDNTIAFRFKGRYLFDEMTGDANLIFDSTDDSGDNGEYRIIIVNNLVDYNGTISQTYADGVANRFYLNNVNLSDGNVASVTAQDVYAFDFAMTGAGELSLAQKLVADSVILNHAGTLNVTGAVETSKFQAQNAGTNSTLSSLAIANRGTLYMNYEGTLDITDLSLAATTTLIYNTQPELLSIMSDDITGLDVLNVSVLDLDRATLAAGVELGISTDILETDISILGFNDYRLENNGSNFWKLTIAESAIVDLDGWDINWGTDELLQAPVTPVPTVITPNAGANTHLGLFNGTSSAGVAYTSNGITTATITGGGAVPTGYSDNSLVYIYGGSAGASATTNSWINVEGGDFFLIGGGGTSYNPVANFTGNSHVVINQATGSIAYVVGGIHQDALSPTFLGDSFVSIYSNTVSGSIIGGNTNTQNGTTTFNGDTHVYVYTPLNQTATLNIHSRSGDLAGDFIIGSNARGSSSGSNASIHNGSSQVTIDLSDYTGGVANFSKQIIGNSYVSGSTHSATHTGDSMVSITGHSDVTFDDRVRGGSFVVSGTHTLHGHTSVEIVSGNFTNRLIGADEITTGTTTINGTSSVEITDGSFSDVVIAGFNQTAGTSSIAGTSLDITAGSFTSVIAGSLHVAGSMTNTGGSQLSIAGGTFSSIVTGGSVQLAGAASNTTAGLTDLTITGGTFTGNLIGGSQLAADFAGTLRADGGMSISISGTATLNGDIIGGHYRGSGSAQSTINTGDVAIKLYGGQINGDVYAAGYLGETPAADNVTTQSTAVHINQQAVFGADVVVDGAFGGTGAAGGVVTGDQKLILEGDGTFGELADVSFQNFDSVEVQSANATASIAITASNLTKTGAGTLELAAGDRATLTVDAGTLKLGNNTANNTITTLSVNDGSTLDLTADNVGVSGELSLAAGSALKMDITKLTSTLATQVHTLTVNTTASDKLTLDLGGAALEADYDLTLFRGIDTLTGITFTNQLGYQAANAADYFEGLTGFLVLRDSGATLALLESLVSDVTWLGGNGNFSDVNWDTGSGVAQALQDSFSVTFDATSVPAGGATVNLDASYSLTEMTVTGTGAAYTFTQDASTTLTLSDGLTVTSGATANFAFHPVLGADATVTIGENSSLSFTSADELSLNSLSSEGSLSTSGALALTSATAQGGTISAASLALATDTANSFDQLTITGKVTNTGVLSVSGTSSMGSLAGEGSSVLGGSLDITSGASLSVGSSVIIRALSNAGNLSVTGGLNILSAVSAGGNITVGTAGDPFEHLRVAEGNNSFGTAIVHGNVIDNKGTLTIGTGSDITGSIDSGSLSSSGTVEVGSLSIALLTNTGTLTTTGNVTLSEATTQGGIIDVGTALSITGANTFTSVEAQSISSTATTDSLSVSATSSTGSIGELNLRVTDESATFSITGTGDVTLSSFNGQGSLELTHATAPLSLQGASSGKDLTLPSGHLTLGAALTLTGNLITGSTLRLTLDYQPDTSIAALNAQAITGASNIRLNLDQTRLEALGISNATSYNVTNLTTDLAASTTLSFNDTGDDEWIIGSRTYTLGIVGGELNISVVVSGNEWTGTGAWDDQTSDWTGGTLPSALTEAFFFGGGERDVQVAGAKTVNEMEVSDDYSFRGDEISTGTLKITGGTTTFHNSISVTDTTTIATDTGITIAQSTDTDTASLNTAKLIINAKASLEIAESGNATVWSAGTESLGTIVNSGEFTLHGDAAASDGISEHQIASLDSSLGSLSLQNNAEAEIGKLEQANVSIGAGSTLTVTGYGNIHNNLIHHGMIDASMATSIGVTNSSGTGDMDAQHLSLHTSGSTLGTLRVNELSFHGYLEIPTTRRSTSYLTVEDLSSLSGSSISLDVLSINASLRDAHYTLVTATDAASTLDWADVTLHANTVTKLNELIRSGKDVSFSTGQGELAFTVAEATERRWFVSQNSANTPGGSPINSISPIVTVTGNDPATGAIISGQLVSYDILDTVQDVIVDVDYRLDLSHLTRSDTDLDGAVIRNLSGNNSLGLIGKGNEGTASETSLVTLENSELTAVGNLNLRDIIVKTTSAGSAANLQVNSVTSADSTLSVEDGSTLQITDTMTTIDSEFTVAASGSLSIATLDIKDSSLDSEGTVSIGHAVLADGVTLSSTAGDMEIQKLTASNDNGATIGSTAILSGQGGLLSVQEIDAGAGNQIQGEVTLGSGSYLGSYDTGSSVTVTNKEELLLATGDTLSLAIENGSTLRLQDAGTNTLQKLSSTGGSLTLQTHGLALTESSNMVGGTLSFTLNAEEVITAMAADASDANAAQIITAGSQLTLDGTHIVIGQSDSSTLLDITQLSDYTARVLADLNSTGTVASITLDGAALNKYFVNVRYSDGQILADINTDVYSGSVSSSNGRAGAELMNEVLFTYNPQNVDPATGESKHPDLKDVLDSMDSHIAKGDIAAADELAAAFAGSSVTAMGGAMLGTVERQLDNIRNRAISMSNRPIHMAEAPTVQAWINAEGSSSSLDADGTASGYDYNSFGGTVGVDFGGVENLNYGITLTALNGSLTADAPDTASGDLNSYGLSAYAHVKSARWTHSFIASVNLADAKLDRTVQVQSGSYSTTGDTNGYGVGLMYEAAYSYKIGEDEGSLLQPLVSISFAHATLDGYTEQGSDAALTVGEQESSYLTLGVGARIQTHFGESNFNRSATFTLRAMLEADLGDRYTTADMSLSGVSGTQTVTGAEPGNFGGEIGVGLNIPVGDMSGAIFMDASLEFRQAQSDVNATIGYSFSF